MAIPKLQLLEEDSEDSSAAQAWDKSLPKKVLELAARMAAVALAHSEWHRRMTSEKLNQANAWRHLLKLRFFEGFWL